MFDSHTSGHSVRVIFGGEVLALVRDGDARGERHGIERDDEREFRGVFKTKHREEELLRFGGDISTVV